MGGALPVKPRLPLLISHVLYNVLFEVPPFFSADFLYFYKI